MSMRETLRARLDYLNPEVRERVIDDALIALSTPSPFMVEHGAAVLRDLAAPRVPLQQIAERVFSEMAMRAREGA